MSGIVTIILGLVSDLLPLLGVSAAAEKTVAAIVSALTNLLPLVVNEIETVAPMVKQIIEDAKNKNELTPDQVSALNAVSVQYDAEFEKSVAAWQANHGAPTAGN